MATRARKKLIEILRKLVPAARDVSLRLNNKPIGRLHIWYATEVQIIASR